MVDYVAFIFDFHAWYFVDWVCYVVGVDLLGCMLFIDAGLLLCGCLGYAEYYISYSIVRVVLSLSHNITIL